MKRPPSSNAWPGRSVRRRHQQSQIQPQVPSLAGGLVAVAHYYRSTSCQVSNGPLKGLEVLCPRESQALELYPSRRTGFWLLFHQGESPMRDTSAGAHCIVPFGPPNRPSKAVPKMHFLLRKELQPDLLPGAAAAAIPPEKCGVVTGEMLSLHLRKRNCSLLAAQTWELSAPSRAMTTLLCFARTRNELWEVTAHPPAHVLLTDTIEGSWAAVCPGRVVTIHLLPRRSS